MEIIAGDRTIYFCCILAFSFIPRSVESQLKVKIHPRKKTSRVEEKPPATFHKTVFHSQPSNKTLKICTFFSELQSRLVEGEERIERKRKKVIGRGAGWLRAVISFGEQQSTRVHFDVKINSLVLSSAN